MALEVDGKALEDEQGGIAGSRATAWPASATAARVSQRGA